MQPIHLFQLASQQKSWLSTRQTLMAGNIANVNTPGYRAVDIEPFESILESTRLSMSVTERGHIAPDHTSASGASEVEAEKSWDVYHSGGSVSVEQELLKAGSIRRDYSMNTNIVKAFHRMLMSSSRASG